MSIYLKMIEKMYNEIKFSSKKKKKCYKCSFAKKTEGPFKICKLKHKFVYPYDKGCKHFKKCF